MYGTDCESGGWSFSVIWYVIAIILLIIAVIWSFFNASRDKDDEKDTQRNQDNLRNLWLAVIAFGVLAFVQHGYDVRARV